MLIVNFERLDDAVRARKALNGRDVLGSDVGAIRIGFAKVPVKNGSEGNDMSDEGNNVIQGINDLNAGATIQALRNVKGASAIPVDQQVHSGAVENYRSNLLLSMINSGNHNNLLMSDGMQGGGWSPSVTEQQMIVKELSEGSPDAETEILAHAGEYIYIVSILWGLAWIHRFPSSRDVLYHHTLRFREA